ncbi:MAG: hypothetical protein ACOX88_10005 [Christensenellales bacterium]|jgi:hypothetical protein
MMKKKTAIWLLVTVLLVISGCKAYLEKSPEELNSPAGPSARTFRIVENQEQRDVADVLELIYSTDKYEYFLDTPRSDYIMIVFSDGVALKLKDALESNEVTIDELMDEGTLIIYEYPIQE